MAAVLLDSDHSDSPWRKFKGRQTLPSGPRRPKGHKGNFDRNTQQSQHNNWKISHDNWSSRLKESNYSVLKKPYRYNQVRFSKAKNPSRQVFLIVACEYFTKWVEAEAVVAITQKSVEKFLWENIICRFGIPQRIIIDNGPQLKGDKIS